MKRIEVPDANISVSPFNLALATAEKMGEFDRQKDDYKEWTQKAEVLIGTDICEFFDTNVRDWCTQSVSQKYIDSLLLKLGLLYQMDSEEDSRSQIRQEITYDIHSLWLSEEKLREEVKKRGLGQMFLLGGIVVGLSAITLGKVGMENAKNVQFPLYELQVEDLPESLKGVSIVHLTDLHAKNGFMGNPVDVESISKMNETLGILLKEQKLDINKVVIAITGDCFTEGASDEEIREIAEALGKFPGKKFFVLGNHDVRHQNTEFIISELEKNNIQHLDFLGVNEGGLELIGIPDETTQKDLYTPAVISQISKNPEEGNLRILLNHDLTSIDSLLPEMNNTIVLSGHTHGGQVDVLPERWQNWLHNMMNFEYRARVFSGIEQINKNTLVEVSNGVGVHTVPIRFNASPEIPVIVLDVLNEEHSVESSTNIFRKNIKRVFQFRKN